jgi:AraC-like DNA-binding protein
MAMQIQSEVLIARPLACPVGRLSMSGIIHQNKGVSFTNMRIWGSFAVVYLLAGSGRYTDARGVSQKVRAGDLITVFPDIPHAYGPDSDECWDEIYLVFDGPGFDLWRRQGILDDARPVSRLEPIEYWLRRIESVARPSAGQSPLLSVCRLQQVLAEMREHEQARGVGEADQAWLAQAKALLEGETPLAEFDLESVAERLGISYVGFRKKFARLSGTSPAKFHMQSVMDRACDLIRRQGPTNRQVARRLGFCDEFHFSRRFKQLVGLSPREFRQQVAPQRL